MTTTMTTLGQIAMFNLDVHVFTGRKKLNPKDIKGQVPPDTLVSLGTKYYIAREKVTVFESIKRQAERALRKVGIRIMGAYAIPLDRTDELSRELTEIKKRFDEAREDFITHYQQFVTDWMHENYEYRDILEEAVPALSYVANQISFDWQVYQVTPTGNSAVDDNLDTKVQTMGSQLITEVVAEANRCLDQSFILKSKVNQRSMPQVWAIKDKLQGLSFLNKKAYVLGELMESALQETVAMTVIEGKPLAIVKGLLDILSTRDRIEAYGQRLLDGENITNEHLVESFYGDEEQQPATVTSNANEPNMETQDEEKPAENVQSELIPQTPVSKPTPPDFGVWF